MRFLRAAPLAALSCFLPVDAWGPADERNNNFQGRPGGYGPPRCHDSSFVPDYVLRVTYSNISMGCQERASALINNTLPGPEIRLKPGKTSWIRVYNDMTDYNTTIVRCISEVLGLPNFDKS